MSRSTVVTGGRDAWLHLCLAAVLGSAALFCVIPRPARAQDRLRLLAPTLAPEEPQEEAMTSRPLGRLLVFGNTRAESLFIAEGSGLELGRPVGRPALESAVRSLYALDLFSDLWITDESKPHSDQRVLAVHVVENPRVKELSFDGNDKLGDEDLKGDIDLRAGDLLSNRKLFQARKAIEKAYRDQGYASAAVETQVRHLEEAGDVALSFQITEGKRVKIRAVEFVGTEAFSPGKLRGKIQLKPNSLFRRKRYTAERLREDETRLAEFYHNHGYMQAKVVSAEPLFSADASEVRLRFTLDEGPFFQFGHVTWTGNTKVSTERLQAVTPIETGEAFSQEKVDTGTSEAYNLYTEEGYLLELQIAPTTEVSGDSVNVSYQIHEGNPSHVHEIRIVGNTRTKERVIRRELTLVPGNLLRRSVLMRSHRDVFALGFFEDVGVDYKPTGEDSDIDVIFKVKEKSSGTATAGAGFSSDTGITGFVEFGHNNIFGRGQSLNLHLERGSRRKTYDISFTDPWAFGTPTSAGFQLFNTDSDLDIYTERRRGFSLNLGRPWFFPKPDFSRVYASYSLEDLSYSNFQDLDPASEQFLLDSNGTVSRVTLTFSRNSTNNPFYPTGGSRTVLRTEFAGGPLGGDIDYYKPTLDHRNYFVPFWKPAVMLRHRLSYVGSYAGRRVPGSETFRLGGTRTDYLRGYDDWWVVPEENVRIGADGQKIRFPGGKIAYTFTAEYQFPIANPVHGLFFFDAGNTWNSPRDFSLTDLKKGVGAGIRLEIPLLGNVGFDYAYGIDRGKWQPHLIIGPSF
jgi:outer membrane protein insertion porin family